LLLARPFEMGGGVEDLFFILKNKSGGGTDVVWERRVIDRGRELGTGCEAAKRTAYGHLI
jgi:hypothetical protein